MLLFVGVSLRVATVRCALYREEAAPARRVHDRLPVIARRRVRTVWLSRMDLKFPATQPDQTLCFENKRRIINEKHSAWMEQRERALAAEKDRRADAPSLRETLEDVHREAMASISRYDDEKRQLSNLPPARRRVAMQQKRASWMEQRGEEEAPSLCRRPRQPATVRTTHLVTETGTGNTLLGQLHAERQARVAVAATRVATSAQLPPQAAPSDLVMTWQEGAMATRSSSLPTTASRPAFSWACNACTFANAAPALACEMCGLPRDSSPSKQLSRRGTDKGAVDDLDAELGLDEDDRQLDEIEDFLAAVELDLQLDD